MTLLRTNTTLRESIKANLERDHGQLSESIGKILEEWKSRVTTIASLDALIYVLKHCDMANSAEALRKKYYIKDSIVSGTSSSDEVLGTNEYQGNADMDLEKNKLIENNTSPDLCRYRKMYSPDTKNMLRKIRQVLQVVSIILFVVLVFLGFMSWHSTNSVLS